MQATSLSEVRLITRYVALGDSFTAGAPGASARDRWPDQLAAALRAANAELEYHNLGTAGATTPEVAAGQLARCVELEPDLVTVVSGANDVLLHVRPDIGAHAAALDEIFATVRERLPQAIVVTATTPPLAEHIGLHPRSRERVERGMKALNEATRAVAFAHDVMCLEFGDHPAALERDNYAKDGFHPSATGIRRAALASVQELAARHGIRVAGEETA